MADVTATPTTSRVWDGFQVIHAVGTIEVGPDTDDYPTGGIPLDFPADTVDGVGLGLALPGINAQPVHVEVHGKAGYVYEYDQENKKLIIREIPALDGNAASAQPLAELAAATIPAAVVADVIRFHAVFNKMQ